MCVQWKMATQSAKAQKSIEGHAATVTDYWSSVFSCALTLQLSFELIYVYLSVFGQTSRDTYTNLPIHYNYNYTYMSGIEIPC